jgi:hypothetical protein
MNIDIPTQENNSKTIVSTTFHRFTDGVLINIPCNLCDNHTLYVNDIYTLLDFRNNSGIVEHQVKFFDAFLEGYVITLVALDIKTGELLKRKHRINNVGLPCDWLVMDTNYLDPKERRDDLLAFNF